MAFHWQPDWPKSSYNNSGTDANEAIEIAGPVGADLSGWSLVLYSGNGGAAYDTRNLSSIIPN
jgi:uncharacterized protein